MDVPKEQFDSLLGGKEELPTVVSIIKFAKARSQEIAALTEAIEEPQNKHLAFQRMPKHLRRRAMSHNVKRMPRRLQEIHLSQMEKAGLPVKAKRPSRKYRRKPHNLLQEYNRRQRTAVWLETHVWHAKRFRMVERWGYKLPDHPNDKAFRACYRATAKHCLIQDMSYLNCVELQGAEADILNGLSQLTSPDCGLTFAAKSTLSGSREGSVMVFKRGAYPCHAVGRVTFMWCPGVRNSKRTVWIWCHPAFYKEFLHELITVFEFEPEDSSEMDVDDGIESNSTKKLSKRKKNCLNEKSIEMVKLETKSIGKLPKFSNRRVVMTLLKDTLNRFRLTGPLAQVVLTEALRFIEDDFVKPKLKDENAMDVDEVDKPRSSWLTDFYNNETCFNSLQQQRLFWENLKDVNSANELPSRLILPVTVIDPRLSMPSTRIKAVNSGVSAVQTAIPEGLSSCSPLWDAALRNTVTNSKLAPAELNKLRSHALVPGLASAGWLGHHNVSHLPLLLVQRPSVRQEHNQQGYGSGWDVIVPAGWGMPVWIGLVFRGARPGGLRETERLSLETASGPTLPPDTEAGRQLSELIRKQREEKHFRLPPDKRPNYIKLGVVSPFHCPWRKLLQDWHPGGENQTAYVIRNRGQLNFLGCLLNRTKPSVECTFSDRDKTCGLVQVGVEACGRATLGDCSMICVASKKDSKLIKERNGRGPTEPLHEDENEEERKTLRNAHLVKLKRLRKKRLRAKRSLEEKGVFPLKTKRKESPTGEIVRKQAELLKELWLPSEIKNVKNSSSRCVIGFVTCGGFSFTRSQSYGYGFIALSALLNVLEQNRNHFLVRNSTSLQYNFVKLKLLYPV